MSELLSHRRMCPVASRCGGCPRIELSRAQRGQRALDEVAALAREHLGYLPELSWNEQVSPPGYRNRIRLRITEEGALGFFNPEKTSDCAVLEPALRDFLQQLSKRLAKHGRLLAPFQHLEVRSPDLDGVPSIFFTQRPGEVSKRAAPPALAALKESWPTARVAALGITPDEELPEQRFALTDQVYQLVPLGGFLQVNHVVNRSLISALLRKVDEAGIESVADLYCGSGNFLLPLLAQGLRGCGVESNLRSVRSARRALLAQGLSGRVHLADARQLVPALRQELLLPQAPQLLLFDPPRAGLKASARHYAQLGSPTIAYFSCNPASLLGDLAVMSSCGYRVQSLQLFDMFAYTSHVEVMAWLAH